MMKNEQVQYTEMTSEGEGESWIRCHITISDGHVTTVDLDSVEQIDAEVERISNAHAANERGWAMWERFGEEHCE